MTPQKRRDVAWFRAKSTSTSGPYRWRVSRGRENRIEAGDARFFAYSHDDGEDEARPVRGVLVFSDPLDPGSFLSPTVDARFPTHEMAVRVIESLLREVLS